MKHLALAGSLLAIVSGCATTTGKVAGGVALVSTGLAVGVQASSCDGAGDECGLTHGITTAGLLGIAGIAAVTALVAEARHTPTEPAPTPIARQREPVVRAPVPAAAARDPQVVELSASASIEASLGRCTTVAVIGDRIRALDGDYYRTVFLVDPAIARCR